MEFLSLAVFAMVDGGLMVVGGGLSWRSENFDVDYDGHDFRPHITLVTIGSKAQRRADPAMILSIAVVIELRGQLRNCGSWIYID